MTETMIERAAKAILAEVPFGYGMSEPEAEMYARAALEATRIPNLPDDHFSDSDWDWNYRLDKILSQPQEGKE